MSYTWKGEQFFESTKCRSKALANKVLGKREGEMAMQMFKVSQQGERKGRRSGRSRRRFSVGGAEQRVLRTFSYGV